LPEDTLAALLEGFEHHRPAGEVDAIGGERQGLGDAAAGGVEHAAESAHRPGRMGRDSEEGGPLVRPAAGSAVTLD
jgi:hypothetical protein